MVAGTILATDKIKLQTSLKFNNFRIKSGQEEEKEKFHDLKTAVIDLNFNKI